MNGYDTGGVFRMTGSRWQRGIYQYKSEMSLKTYPALQRTPVSPLYETGFYLSEVPSALLELAKDTGKRFQLGN